MGWKPLFYDAMLPILRRLGPETCDCGLAALGRLVSAWPARARDQRAALAAASRALDLDRDPLPASLAANLARFAARDYPLDGLADADVFARFEVEGFEHLAAALDAGRGAIVLGCHLGAYVSGLHWMFRRGVPLRLLAQRPSHVSGYLQAVFDRDSPHPQSGFFLRRRMPAGEGAACLVRARAALRDGLAVYLSGDIPWPSCHARPGRLLGGDRPFQSVWAELAAITGAPILPVFCRHRPGGRYALTFDPPFAADPATAVPRYLARLEVMIAAHPEEAVAHLTWPCYRDEALAPATASGLGAIPIAGR